jgi:hypothetical protein
MSLKLATAVLVAVAVTAGPAFACKGPTVIFADPFQTEDPAWSLVGAGPLTISGGHAQLSSPAGEYTLADYQGMFIDTGDACVDMVGPTVADPSTASAGIVFGLSDGGDFYAFVVEEDGQAAVLRLQNGAWLTPVSWRASPAIKTGGGVTNTARVTWKGTSVSTFINDQPFVTFNIPQAFQNTTFGLMAQNAAPAATTYQFSNLKVTNVP